MTIFASLEWTNFSHRRWVEGIGGRGGSKISEQLFFCMSYKKWMPALSKKWVSAQSKLPNSDVQNISCENWNQIISGYLCMENHRWIARKLDKCDVCPNQCSTILTTGCWERLETLYLAYVFYSTLPPPIMPPHISFFSLPSVFFTWNGWICQVIWHRPDGCVLSHDHLHWGVFQSDEFTSVVSREEICSYFSDGEITPEECCFWEFKETKFLFSQGH